MNKFIGHTIANVDPYQLRNSTKTEIFTYDFDICRWFQNSLTRARYHTLTNVHMSSTPYPEQFYDGKVQSSNSGIERSPAPLKKRIETGEHEIEKMSHRLVDKEDQ